MKRRLTLAAGLLTLLMSGCALHERMHEHMHGPGQADPANPKVLVKNGKLSVNLEPLRFSKADGSVNITWHLPPGDVYAFATNGIVVEPAVAGTKAARNVVDEFQCGPGKTPTEYTCLNRNTGPGKYKYTVRVLEKGVMLEPLDPFIINDF